jgi:CRAL/TRIO domain
LTTSKLKAILGLEEMKKKIITDYETMQAVNMPACAIAATKAAKASGNEKPSVVQFMNEIEQSCTVIDVEGVGMFEFVKIKIQLNEITSMMMNSYPETMGRTFFINPSRVFSGIWPAIMMMLDEGTKKKISLVETKDVFTTLSQYISPENIPLRYGGKCSCNGNITVAPKKQCEDLCIRSNIGPWKSVSQDEIEAARSAATEAAKEHANRVRATISPKQ